MADSLPDGEFYWIAMLRGVGDAQASAAALMERLRTENRAVDRRDAPAHRCDALVADRGLDPATQCRGETRLGRQEHADGGQVPFRDPNVGLSQLAHEERAGRFQHDAGTVAGTAVGGARAAMLHRRDGGEGEADDLVGGAVRQVGEETDAAGVMLFRVH